jgi:hypothetical protein
MLELESRDLVLGGEAYAGFRPRVAEERSTTRTRFACLEMRSWGDTTIIRRKCAFLVELIKLILERHA